MKAFDAIERLAREVLDDLKHGEPACTFKLGTIIRIAQEQRSMAELESKA